MLMKQLQGERVRERTREIIIQAKHLLASANLTKIELTNISKMEVFPVSLTTMLSVM